MTPACLCRDGDSGELPVIGVDAAQSLLRFFLQLSSLRWLPLTQHQLIPNLIQQAAPPLYSSDLVACLDYPLLFTLCSTPIFTPIQRYHLSPAFTKQFPCRFISGVLLEPFLCVGNLMAMGKLPVADVAVGDRPPRAGLDPAIRDARTVAPPYCSLEAYWLELSR